MFANPLAQLDDAVCTFAGCEEPVQEQGGLCAKHNTSTAASAIPTPSAGPSASSTPLPTSTPSDPLVNAPSITATPSVNAAVPGIASANTGSPSSAAPSGVSPHLDPTWKPPPPPRIIRVSKPLGMKVRGTQDGAVVLSIHDKGGVAAYNTLATAQSSPPTSPSNSTAATSGSTATSSSPAVVIADVNVATRDASISVAGPSKLVPIRINDILIAASHSDGPRVLLKGKTDEEIVRFFTEAVGEITLEFITRKGQPTPPVATSAAIEPKKKPSNPVVRMLQKTQSLRGAALRPSVSDFFSAFRPSDTGRRALSPQPARPVGAAPTAAADDDDDNVGRSRQMSKEAPARTAYGDAQPYADSATVGSASLGSAASSAASTSSPASDLQLLQRDTHKRTPTIDFSLVSSSVSASASPTSAVDKAPPREDDLDLSNEEWMKKHRRILSRTPSLQRMDSAPNSRDLGSASLPSRSKLRHTPTLSSLYSTPPPIALSSTRHTSLFSTKGKAVAPGLGLMLEETNDRQGCRVVRVAEAARLAGFLVGDTITHVSGRPLPDLDHVSVAFDGLEPGDTVVFSVIRKGNKAMTLFMETQDSENGEFLISNAKAGSAAAESNSLAAIVGASGGDTSALTASASFDSASRDSATFGSSSFTFRERRPSLSQTSPPGPGDIDDLKAAEYSVSYSFSEAGSSIASAPTSPTPAGPASRHIPGVAPVIGLTLEDTSDKNGCKVTALKAQPAIDAGFLVGDIVTQVNDRSLLTLLDLKSAFDGVEPGDVLAFKVIRVESPAPFVLNLTCGSRVKTKKFRPHKLWRRLTNLSQKTPTKKAEATKPVSTDGGDSTEIKTIPHAAGVSAAAPVDDFRETDVQWEVSPLVRMEMEL